MTNMDDHLDPRRGPRMLMSCAIGCLITLAIVTIVLAVAIP